MSPGHISLDTLRLSATVSLFEGGRHAGVGVTMFVVRTPPGEFVKLHTHPYAETFVLLAGSGRWTAGDEVIEAGPESIITVPPDALHGFRNTGHEPLLLVSVHESPTLVQEFIDRAPS
jgi:quercetin dioxygenase-like cupin family protein